MNKTTIISISEICSEIKCKNESIRSKIEAFEKEMGQDNLERIIIDNNVKAKDQILVIIEEMYDNNEIKNQNLRNNFIAKLQQRVQL